jgi:hypothetical protein
VLIAMLYARPGDNVCLYAAVVGIALSVAIPGVVKGSPLFPTSGSFGVVD